MKVMFIIVLSYLLTGVMCIIWDFRKPFIDRPAYARNPSRYLKGFLITIFGWLPIKFLMAVQYRVRGEAIKAIVTFVILVIGGNYLAG